MPLPETFEVELVSSTPISPSVRALRLRRVDGAPLVFAPGQWVNLTVALPTGELRRAYSIASAPAGTPEFDLAITHVEGGAASPSLCTLPTGTRLRATGPQGFFTRAATDPAPALFIATGTGITPLRSMLHAALRAGSVAPMRVLIGVRTEGDLLYREEFAALEQAHPNLRVACTLSRPDESWTGLRGYVQGHVEPLWRELAGLSAGAPHAWVCGLQRMVSGVRDLLRNDLGAERQQVHSERYD